MRQTSIEMIQLETLEGVCVDKKPKIPRISEAVLAQFVAVFGNSLTAFSIGMMLSIPPIVNGSLMVNKDGSMNTKRGPDEILSLYDDEASWFGSLLYIVQPVACFVGGILQNYIGRKYGMILMNIPAVTSWFLLYQAKSVSTLYICSILFGISCGFIEAPGIAYICEIAEPRLRGIFTLYASFNVGIAFMLEFLLASYTNWRTVAFFSMMLPLLNLPFLVFMPDSPVWLLSKNRKEEALHALCWLRGWVPKEQVAIEFDELCQYIESGKQAAGNTKAAAEILKPETRKPLAIILLYGLFSNFACASGARNYSVNIFDYLRTPIKAETLGFINGICGLIGNICCILTLPKYGKRKLTLLTTMLCSSASILIGVYTFYYIEIDIPWIPAILFCIISYGLNLGVGYLPWVMMGEVFPQRTRTTCVGLAAATMYVYSFGMNKTYINLNTWIGLHGCFIFYGTVGLLGFVYLYLYMPETEGKSLAQIEEMFLSESKKGDNYFRKF